MKPLRMKLVSILVFRFCCSTRAFLILSPFEYCGRATTTITQQCGEVTYARLASTTCHQNDSHRLSQSWIKPRTSLLQASSADREEGDDDDDDDDHAEKIAEFGANRRNPQWQERSQYWILLVDDDDDLRQAVGAFLDQQGYQVTACASAETALEWLSDNNKNNNNNNNQPSLIVSDIRMPGGMDGLEFLKRLRENPSWVSLPVVLLTAKGQTRDRIAGYNAGADAYLPKPFAPTELLSVLDGLLARQKRFTNPSVTMQDLQRDIADIKSLLQKGGAGVGVNGFVEATNVFLAPDERQVLELLCQGLPNKEIAAQAFVSSRRVEQLLTGLYRKTNVANRTELVRWAIRTGTIRL